MRLSAPHFPSHSIRIRTSRSLLKNPHNDTYRRRRRYHPMILRQKKTPDQRRAAAGMASRRYFEDWGFPSTASSSSVSMDVSHGKPAFSLSLRLRPAPGANVLFRVAKFSRFNQPTTIHSSLLGGRVFQLPKPKRARATNTWASNFSRGRKWKCFLCVICIIGRSDAAIWEGDVIVSYRHKISQTHRYCCVIIRVVVPSLLFQVFLWKMCLSGVWLPSSNLWLWQSVSCKKSKRLERESKGSYLWETLDGIYRDFFSPSYLCGCSWSGLVPDKYRTKGSSVKK